MDLLIILITPISEIIVLDENRLPKTKNRFLWFFNQWGYIDTIYTKIRFYLHIQQY
jgi:hypothetical protein